MGRRREVNRLSRRFPASRFASLTAPRRPAIEEPVTIAPPTDGLQSPHSGRGYDRGTVHHWRIYGYDAGWNDPRVLLEIGKTPYDRLVVLDEFHEPGTHVEDAIRWLTEHDKPMGTIFCEHEPADIEKFTRVGFRAELAEKSIDAGVAEVRKRLQDDGNIGATAGGESRGFIITSMPSASPRSDPHATAEEDDAEEEIEPRVGLLGAAQCRNLVREFHGYKEEHVGTARAVDHRLDSLRYAVMGVGTADFSHHRLPKQ